MVPSDPPEWTETAEHEMQPWMKLCAGLCKYGAQEGFEEVHIGTDARVEARKEGVWYEIMRPPSRWMPLIVRHLKAVAGLDLIHHLPEQRKPLVFVVGGKEVAVNVIVRRSEFGVEDVTVDYRTAAG